MTEVRDRILSLLRQAGDGFVSGEEISRGAGVSRTAVWKQIGQLRRAGYVIDGLPSQGYRLAAAPDLLTPEEIEPHLATRWMGRRMIYLQETDSTNLRAREIGDAGEPEGLVVLADGQSAGRGRLGRRWISPPGLNLYASVLLRPDIGPGEASQLTFLAAAAVARTVAAAGDLRPTVKWPNDVLLDGRKTAGILSEMNAETEKVNYVILGIGVNLNMSADQFPEDLRFPATSVALAAGRPIPRAVFAANLMGQLEELYLVYKQHGFAPVKAAWEEHFDWQGQMVAVENPGGGLTGRVVGIDEVGALLLRMENGTLHQVVAGDVRPV